MLLREEREQVVEYGKKLITTGLTSGTGGNISVYNNEEKLIAVSPSGIDYFETEPEDIVIIDLDGEVIDGNRKPSTEVELHRIFYNRRSNDIRAVVHAHSTFSTILATLGWEIPASNYYIGLVGGNNVRCGLYETPGSFELAEATFNAMEGRYAALMANHGLLAGSGNIADAFNIADETERMAKIYYYAKLIGEPNILSDEDVNIMLEGFKSYGQVQV